MHNVGRLKGHCNLLSRVIDSCVIYNISFVKYMLDSKYAKSKKSSQNTFTNDNGCIDTLRLELFIRDITMLILLPLSF